MKSISHSIKKSVSKIGRPIITGEPRGAFGTRLCQRVKCQKCEKYDYVSKLLGNARDVYCRDCAEKYLSVFDKGRIVESEKVQCICIQCHKEFLVPPIVAEKKSDLMCKDCLRGFDTWRGKAGVSSTKNSSIIVKSSSNIVIRKHCQ